VKDFLIAPHFLSQRFHGGFREGDFPHDQTASWSA
jgi:hypothetical protein